LDGLTLNGGQAPGLPAAFTPFLATAEKSGFAI
jgi:hypothetical protein